MMKTMLTGSVAAARNAARVGLAIAFINLVPSLVRAEDLPLNPDEPVVWRKIPADEPAPAAPAKVDPPPKPAKVKAAPAQPAPVAAPAESKAIDVAPKAAEAPASTTASDARADEPVTWVEVDEVAPMVQAPPAEAEKEAEPAPAAGEKPAEKPAAKTEAEEKPAAKDEPAAESEKAPSPFYGASTTNRIKARYTGRIRLEYEYKKLGSDTDQDLYGYWNIGGYNMGNGHLDIYTSGRLETDLDKPGTPPSQADDPYVSVADTSGTTEQRVLQLYADVHDRKKFLTLRAGRQYVEIADYLHVDGAQITYHENTTFGGRIYAGQPVSYYESLSGDFALGASLVGQPWRGNRSRFTFARYQDDEKDGTDQNYFLDISQQISDDARARGQLSYLNDEFRMARADVYYFAPDGESDMMVGGSRWGSFDAETRAYSPLYDTLGEQEPYSYAYVRFTHALVPQFLVAPGVSFRFVDDPSEDYSNRNYSDLELSLIYEPSKAFSSSISFQYWNVDGYDEFLGVSWDARYRYRKVWELSLGTAYAQYNYDTYSDISYEVNGGQTVIAENGTVIEESPFVYTYFLRGKWNLTKKLALKIYGDIEDDSETGDLAYRSRGTVEVKF